MARCPACNHLTERLRITNACLRVTAALTAVYPFTVFAPLPSAIFIFIVGLCAPVGLVVSLVRRADCRRQLAAHASPQLPAARVVKC